MVAHKGDSALGPPAQQTVGLAILTLQPPVLAALDCLLQNSLGTSAGMEWGREREVSSRTQKDCSGQVFQRCHPS
jgi:hypothetical protein